MLSGAEWECQKSISGMGIDVPPHFPRRRFFINISNVFYVVQPPPLLGWVPQQQISCTLRGCTGFEPVNVWGFSCVASVGESRHVVAEATECALRDGVRAVLTEGVLCGIPQALGTLTSPSQRSFYPSTAVAIFSTTAQ